MQILEILYKYIYMLVSIVPVVFFYFTIGFIKDSLSYKNPATKKSYITKMCITGILCFLSFGIEGYLIVVDKLDNLTLIWICVYLVCFLPFYLLLRGFLETYRGKATGDSLKAIRYKKRASKDYICAAVAFVVVSIIVILIVSKIIDLPIKFIK